ncbi:PREDICTED: uncharacterized protein LOC104810857 [Tarenaya hassleriana]|uniref:uncharacterized protein LOC104810857 n=1 Tax=Tarenaya hassleriana TaxID=28532 RepID=UPI00053C2018|nr:PREDICTED: uncharacterized protein LOC104810857 [Tarenaya hassleriana]
MTYPTSCLILFSCSLSLLLSFSNAGSRPPHSPSYYSPAAFSPAAYDFFHPKSHSHSPENPRNSPAPLPLRANVEAEAQESKVSSEKHRDGNRVGAGVVVGIGLGLTFLVFLATGTCFVMNKRRVNVVRTISVRPDA